MSETISFDQAVELLLDRGADGRSITAIAGPPAAGKSTTSAALVSELNRIDAGSAAVLQMDGFHFDDAVLKSRNLLSRKGAPQTFDTGGLACTLLRLRRNREAEIAVPVFDRSIETSRAGAILISSTVRHVLVEGNYLLLRAAPWSDMARYFDTTIFVSADIDTIRRRLTSRWERANLDPEVIKAKVEANDLLNAQTVITGSSPAEFVLSVKTPHRR
jgi:pantothenate kinase